MHPLPSLPNRPIPKIVKPPEQPPVSEPLETPIIQEPVVTSTTEIIPILTRLRRGLSQGRSRPRSIIRVPPTTIITPFEDIHYLIQFQFHLVILLKPKELKERWRHLQRENNYENLKERNMKNHGKK